MNIIKVWYFCFIDFGLKVKLFLLCIYGFYFWRVIELRYVFNLLWELYKKRIIFSYKNFELSFVKVKIIFNEK